MSTANVMFLKTLDLSYSGRNTIAVESQRLQDVLVVRLHLKHKLSKMCSIQMVQQRSFLWRLQLWLKSSWRPG